MEEARPHFEYYLKHLKSSEVSALGTLVDLPMPQSANDDLTMEIKRLQKMGLVVKDKRKAYPFSQAFSVF